MDVSVLLYPVLVISLIWVKGCNKQDHVTSFAITRYFATSTLEPCWLAILKKVDKDKVYLLKMSRICSKLLKHGFVEFILLVKIPVRIQFLWTRL